MQTETWFLPCDYKIIKNPMSFQHGIVTYVITAVKVIRKEYFRQYKRDIFWTAAKAALSMITARNSAEGYFELW